MTSSTDTMPPWRRRAFLASAFAAAIALGGNILAWTMAVTTTPVRPSLVHGAGSAALAAMALAFVLGVAGGAFSRIKPASRWILCAAMLLLAPSNCCLGIFLAGPPGEYVQYRWDSAADANLRATANAIDAFAATNRRLPRHLDELVTAGLVTNSSLRDPATGARLLYAFATSPAADASPTPYLLYTPPAPERQSRARLADGDVCSVSDAEIADALRQLN